MWLSTAGLRISIELAGTCSRSSCKVQAQLTVRMGATRGHGLRWTNTVDSTYPALTLEQIMIKLSQLSSSNSFWHFFQLPSVFLSLRLRRHLQVASTQTPSFMRSWVHCSIEYQVSIIQADTPVPYTAPPLIPFPALAVFDL